MPQENGTPIARGPGSVAPAFTAPSVEVATPGRQLQAPPTDRERFRDAIIAAGRGVASAVSARASINSRLKSLKEQSVARVEQDLNRAARSFQAQRLTRADSQRQQILVEAEDKGMEWAERQFRSSMTNASSGEEARLWESAWRGAASQVDRSNAEAQQQAFNSAKRTMAEVGLSLEEELAENPALRAQLQGNGTSISARTQNWMLERISRELDLDNMNPEDADFLIHQTVVQASRIADSLRSAHTQQVESSNLQNGMRQIQDDLLSTASGDQDGVQLRNQVAVTLRDRLNHLTLDQQRAFVRDQVQGTLTQLASGGFGLNASTGIQNATELLDLTVGGEKLFNPSERMALANQVFEKSERTITRQAAGEVAKLKESTRVPVTLPDGSVIFRPNPAAEQSLLLLDETGRDAYDRLGDRILADMGLNGEDASIEEALMIGQVRIVMAQQRGGQVQEDTRRTDRILNHNAVFEGGVGDGNKAYDFDPLTRAQRSRNELGAAKQDGLSESETASVREILLAHAASPEEEAAARAYAGGDLDKPTRNLLQRAQARKWQVPGVQETTGMPTSLIKDKLAMLRSNDPDQVEALQTFITSLDSGASEGWNNLLEGVDANEGAAMQWLRIHGRLGQPVAGPNAGIGADPATLTDQIQTILNAAPTEGWLRGDTGDLELTTTNAGNMAGVLSDIIVEDNGDVDFEPDDRDRFANGLQAQLREMFLSQTDQTGGMIRNLWFAGRTVNQDLDDTAVGSMIWTWMKKQGAQFREVNDRQVIVFDPIGYTGKSGQPISEHVASHMTREFTPEYRSFLQEAMGVKPKDTPATLQGLLMSSNPALKGTDEFARGVLTPRWSTGDQSSGRMLESRANYGGFVVNGQMADGTVLAPVVSRNDANLAWPDGTSVFVPKGTVLNVINPDLFAPARPVPVRFPSILPPAFEGETLTPDRSQGLVNFPRS